MKSIAIVASRDAVADGDVLFLNKKKIYSFDDILYVPNGNRLHCTKNGLLISFVVDHKFTLKLLFLWFWHIIVLKKSHVYLTGVNR